MKTKYRKRPIEAHNEMRMQYIAGLLKEHRLWLGLSRLEVEEEFGISRSVLERVESPNALNISMKTLMEVADVYQVSLEELFQGVE